MNFDTSNFGMPKLNITDNIIAVEITKLYLKNTLSKEDFSDLEKLTKTFNEVFSNVCNVLEDI